jgi:biopolymer transport protein ExbD
MSKFTKKRGKASPAISTASLPDIIFMLLFFFMVVTVMRSSDRLVDVIVPTASELTKLEKKSLVNQIYIGKPKEQYRDIYGSAARIQLNDKISDEDDIPIFLEKHKIKVPENQRTKITTSLRVDGEVTMGIVQDGK